MTSTHMIDELVQYKKTHYPDDQRRILTCGISDGKIRVEWLKAAAPGVDSRWEMRLYGLVRMGERETSDSVPARDSGDVPQGGGETSGRGRR